MEGKLIFKEFSDYFVENFAKMLEVETKNISIKFMIPSVYESLVNNIVNSSMLVLVYELNLHREQNKLQGETAESRYTYYIQYIQSENFRNYLFEKYPILKEIIERKIVNTKNFILEIMNNLERNKEVISSKFNVDLQEVHDINLGEGDDHNGGRTVCIIKTRKNKKIVYKPHSLITDVVLSRFIEIINSYSDTDKRMKIPDFLNFIDFGIQEFISYVEPSDNNALKKLYFNIGRYLGLCYFLNSSDMHYENIIINNDTPFFIDTETLMTPSHLSTTRKKNYSTGNTFEETVLYSAMLPFNDIDNILETDLSGILGGTDGAKEMYLSKVSNANLDTMKIERKLIRIDAQETTNKPQNIDIFKQFVNIRLGFRDVWNVFKKAKNEIVELLDMDLFFEVRFRHIVRHTLSYVKFLEASKHPVYLQSREKREELFNLLRKHGDGKRIEYEIECLNADDVPTFYCNFYSNDLFSHDGKILLSDYFATSPEAVIRRKLDESWNKNSLAFQESIIEKSFMSKLEDVFENQLNMKEVSHGNNENKFLNVKEKVDQFFEVSKYLLSNFSLSESDVGTDVLISKLSPQGNQISYLPLDIYEGGILGFYINYAYFISDKVEDQTIAKNILFTHFKRYKYEKENSMLVHSFFDGHWGIAYYLFLYWKLSSDLKALEAFNEVIYDVLEFLDKRESSEVSKEFISGISSLYIFLNNVNKEYSSPDIEVLLSLLHCSVEQDFLSYRLDVKTGFAHGISGIVYALMSAEDAFGNRENEIFDLLKREELEFEEWDNNDWCRGIGGLIITRLDFIKKSTDSEYCSEMRETLKNMILKFLENNRRYKSFCICHGLAGSLHILNQCYDSEEIFDKELLKVIKNEKNLLLNWIVNNTIDCNTKYDFKLDSFMLGEAGVFHQLSREVNQNIPSIIDLELNVECNVELVKSN